MARYWVVAGVVAIGCRFNFDPIGGSSSTNDGNGGSGSDGGMTSGPDAAIPCTGLEQTMCSTAGGTCDNGICTIVATPGGFISCPDMTCHVLCGANTCDNGLVCPASATCAMYCTGTNSCSNGMIQCSGATCDVHCDADSTCQGLDLLSSNGTIAVHCCNFNNVCNMDTCGNGCVLTSAGCP
ncbi:MAG TPA: hypothetical protein VF403_05110 [Kofleriaceae bacterium]